MATKPYISEFRITDVDETYVYFNFKISGDYVLSSSLPSVSNYDEGDIIYLTTSIVACSSNQKELKNSVGSSKKLAHGISEGDTDSYDLVAMIQYQGYKLGTDGSGGTERYPEKGVTLTRRPDLVKDGWTEYIVEDSGGPGWDGYYYIRESELGWEKYGSSGNDVEEESFTIAIQNPSGNFKFLNKNGKALSRGDTFPLSAINGSQGIQNMDDFQAAAEAWYKWKNGTTKTCPSWDDGTGKLTAAQVNKIFAYVGLTGGYSQGDPISFDIFSKLQNRISE